MAGVIAIARFAMQKVLLVDDSAIMHMAIRELLDGESLEFHSAHSGESGLAMASTLKPDVILLDIEMPEPDGFEVCRRLKWDAELRHIPVIFLTAHDSTEHKVKGLDLGAIDYITKPCNVAELQARVRVALRIKYLMDLLATTARIDGLTGLWNRTYLDHRIVTEIALVNRHASRVGCMMIDIDHFKSVNDRFGHRVGDQVLREIADCLRSGCRVEDVVGRYGGEEFTILTPGVEEGLLDLAERLRREIAAKVFTAGDHKFHVTASFGITDSREGPVEAMIDRADKALYAAKAAGRNCVIRAAA
jgi:diguanylate cyclase (GGDEF)-like protein